MNTKYINTLFLLIIVALLGYIGFNIFNKPTIQNTTENEHYFKQEEIKTPDATNSTTTEVTKPKVVENTTTPSTSIKTGTVTGKLTAGIIWGCNGEECQEPLFLVEICFKNIISLNTICDKKTFNKNYNITLPVGTYEVFSSDTNYVNRTANYTYYSDYLACYNGKSPIYGDPCEKVPHTKKHIIVKDRETIYNVDPADYVR